ncbi:hypothetical protein BDV19DRAFT_393880 [Aspergillus venezuelensis]
MSVQQPFRRLALRPLNLTLQTPMTPRLPTRRAFTLATTPKPVAPRQTPLQSQLQTLFRTRRAFHTSRSRLNNNQKSAGPGYSYQAPGAAPSLSQRLKHLSKEYGWSALWIYLFLSALDFPFCFMAVRLLGADKIGHYEHVIVDGFKGAVNKVVPGVFDQEEEKGVDEQAAEAEAEQKQEAKKKGPAEEASLWTQLALAYAIHKSFIFVRVPLTAAITPKVVKQLRAWGWDVLKGKPKSM